MNAWHIAYCEKCDMKQPFSVLSDRDSWAAIHSQVTGPGHEKHVVQMWSEPSAPAPPPTVGFTTDKVRHGYLPTYFGIAAEIGTAGRVCEVGVLHGESLEMWQSLFPDGLILGIDIDPQATWPLGTRRIVAAQDDPDLRALVRKVSEDFDLIVDDASHDGDLSETTFRLLWPLVRPGGYYVVEDWQVAFWHSDNRGYGRMGHMVASLLDHLEKSDGSVESILYRFGMAIVRKAR